MFSLTNAIVLGAEGCEHRGLVLALDANSREEFQQLVSLVALHYTLAFMMM